MWEEFIFTLRVTWYGCCFWVSRTFQDSKIYLNALFEFQNNVTLERRTDSKRLPCVMCTKLEDHEQKCCYYLPFRRNRRCRLDYLYGWNSAPYNAENIFVNILAWNVLNVMTGNTSVQLVIYYSGIKKDEGYFNIVRRSLSAKLVLWKCNDTTHW